MGFHRDIEGWHSPRLHMHMPIARYGHWGPALLLFPTWQSDFMEAEYRGLIHTVAPLLEAGRLTLFCINSISPHAWCNEHLSLPEKAHRQAQFSFYVEEVVPFIRDRLHDGQARIAVAGASFGAFYAANALFRRPDLFHALLGMSGFYELGGWLHGYSDEQVYFNNPMWFVPHLSGWQLETLRRHCHIELLAGQGQHEYPHASVDFSRVLAAQEIPHRLDLWGYDVPHDWPTWRHMFELGVRERLGW